MRVQFFLSFLVLLFSFKVLASEASQRPRIQIDPHYSELKEILEEKGYDVVLSPQEVSPGDYILISHHDPHIHEEEPYRAWGLFFKKGEGLEKTPKGNFKGESKKSFLKAAKRLLEKVPAFSQIDFANNEVIKKRSHNRLIR